jgi:sulfatase maturation enzyme AslB (radical SAM superfamily)
MSDCKAKDCNAFCPLPWIMTAVRNNGDIRACAQANTAKSRGIFRKNDGTPYNINKDSIEDSRNSELVKEMRKSMLNGISPEPCLRCEREEINNIPSRREYEQKESKDFFTFEDAKKITASDGTISTRELPLKYLDLRFGNKCNTKCRMCGPTDSDLWYNDYVNLWDYSKYKDNDTTVQLVENKNKKWVPQENIYNWIESDNFWKNVENNLQNLVYIHTVGGEPLLIKRQFDLLEKCVELDIAKNITLEYNTNGTILPEKAMKYWKNFKLVKIGLSIDGIEEVNDYIRHPSKWASIEKNIHQLDKMEGDVWLWFSYTVQAYNILHLKDMMKWRVGQSFERFGNSLSDPFISPHPLHNPKHLSVKMFPKEVKEKVSSSLREFYNWLDDHIIESEMDLSLAESFKKSSRKIIEGYIDFMNSEDLSDQLTKFWAVTKRLDQLRGESFEKTFPELYEYLEPHITSLGIRELEHPRGL